MFSQLPMRVLIEVTIGLKCSSVASWWDIRSALSTQKKVRAVSLRVFPGTLLRARVLELVAHAADDREARYQMCAETTDPSRVRSPHGAARPPRETGRSRVDPNLKNP